MVLHDDYGASQMSMDSIHQLSSSMKEKKLHWGCGTRNAQSRTNVCLLVETWNETRAWPGASFCLPPSTAFGFLSLDVVDLFFMIVRSHRGRIKTMFFRLFPNASSALPTYCTLKPLC